MPRVIRTQVVPRCTLRDVFVYTMTSLYKRQHVNLPESDICKILPIEH